MQDWYPAAFEREAGFTEDDWRRVLPAALAPAGLDWRTGGADARFEGGGRLALDWRVLAPRRIALMTLPRLAVRFAFTGLADDARQHVMRRFDLVTQRGGG